MLIEQLEYFLLPAPANLLGMDARQAKDGPDVLSMRDTPTHLFRHLNGKDQVPFLVAAGADTSLAAGKGDHHFMMAVGTPYPGKTEMQIPDGTTDERVAKMADDFDQQ